MSHVLIAEFRRYASEAEQMARSARSAEEKKYWTGLAERWLRCAYKAEQAEHRTPANPAKRRRTSDPIKRKRNAA